MKKEKTQWRIEFEKRRNIRKGFRADYVRGIVRDRKTGIKVMLTKDKAEAVELPKKPNRIINFLHTRYGADTTKFTPERI